MSLAASGCSTHPVINLAATLHAPPRATDGDQYRLERQGNRGPPRLFCISKTWSAVSIPPIEPRIIPAEARERLRIMFIAKHAKWAGGLHPDDGNHALYHVETREMLQGLGLNLVLEDNYEALFQRPDVDFLFPLLNRGGFLNSEMMLPLLCTRVGLPYLGATPILRGLADDKHLTKMA